MPKRGFLGMRQNTDEEKKLLKQVGEGGKAMQNFLESIDRDIHKIGKAFNSNFKAFMERLESIDQKIEKIQKDIDQIKEAHKGERS